MPEFIDAQNLVQTVATLVAAYAALRVELKRVVGDTLKAHERIDRHIDDHLKGVFKNVK